MNGYDGVYANEWDKIVSHFILRDEPFQGYWALSEDYALAFVDRVLRRNPKRRLLDLGCGQGRLLNRFANDFQEIVAVDSVKSRISLAQRTAEVTGLQNVVFVNKSFEDCYTDLGEFDMVLCSHVLQHVNTTALEAMIDRIGKVLVRGGVLVLVTAHSGAARDTFKLWRLDEKGNSVTERIFRSALEFDEFVDRGSPINGIPTHAFSILTLRNILKDYKLRKVHFFHALYKRKAFDSALFRDCLINLPGLKGLFGIDVLVIGEKC